jgi:hypothetical protein
MTHCDDDPPCATCSHFHAGPMNAAWANPAVTHRLCRHPSAAKYGAGGEWAAVLARELCKGRRHEPVVRARR